MNRLTKEIESQQPGLKKEIYRCDDEMDGYMIGNKKAAGCSNIQTAQLNILQFHFTQFLMPVKVACCIASTRLTTNAWGLVL